MFTRIGSLVALVVVSSSVFLGGCAADAEPGAANEASLVSESASDFNAKGLLAGEKRFQGGSVRANEAADVKRFGEAPALQANEMADVKRFGEHALHIDPPSTKPGAVAPVVSVEGPSYADIAQANAVEAALGSEAVGH